MPGQRSIEPAPGAVGDLARQLQRETNASDLHFVGGADDADLRATWRCLHRPGTFLLQTTYNGGLYLRLACPGIRFEYQ